MANSPKNYDRWGGVTPVKVVKPSSINKNLPKNKDTTIKKSK